MKQILVIFFLYWNFVSCLEDPITLIEKNELAKGHLKYIQKSNDQCTAKECNKQAEDRICWGYEDGCVEGKHFHYPTCTSTQFHSMKEQQKLFWEQGDFGYVKKRLDTMRTICKENDKKPISLLRCSENWEYCEAKNLFLDLKEKNFDTNDAFIGDFFGAKEIGGSCSVNDKILKEKVRFDGELNSWNADLRHFSRIKNYKKKCDVVITKPTIFMKLDSGFNLFHHFCDFVNLYASQHINGSFTRDVLIVVWYTSSKGYYDMFEESWKAFTKHPRLMLSDYRGKKVCFKDAIFSMPPRMVFGLYYNLNIEQNCHGTKLFEAFTEHFTHRLGIKQDEVNETVVRVTLLKRSTKYRKILNEDELIGAMKKVEGLNVTAFDYKHGTMSFIDQIRRSHNSDVLIGMHGAGLTHMLFQPQWGALFELYNTEDPDCYRDLAKLRGVEYFTWENKEFLFQQDKGHHPTLGEHPKFTNYAFNVNEFMRILTKAVKGVLKRRKRIKHKQER